MGDRNTMQIPPGFEIDTRAGEMNWIPSLLVGRVRKGSVLGRPGIDRVIGAVSAAIMLLLIPFVLSGCGKSDGAKASASVDAKTPGPVVMVSTMTVTTRDLSSYVDVTGTLAPLPGAESRVSPVTPGRVKTVLVQNGDRVSQGQLIATLDPGPLIGQEQQAAAAVRSASAALEQAKANYASSVKTNSAAIQAARTNVQASKMALQKLMAGSRPEEIANAQAAEAAAHAAVISAQQSLARQQSLLAAGLVAKKDVQAAELQLATAQAALKSAQQDLLMKEKPNRPQDVAAARIAVQQSQDALNAAQAASSQNQVKQGDVAVAEQQLASAQGALAAARAQLAAQFIRAPVSGIILQRSVNPGEYVDTTGAICTIADLSRVRVILQVPSSSVSAVRPGDVVDFTADSQPGRTYQALVSLVGTAVTMAGNTVPVEAIAANPTGQLRDNGFVHARILTATHQHVLTVPASSIVLLENKPTVFVVSADNVAHAHPVGEGIREGALVEILSGLKSGDRVVTSGAYELNDGTRVKITSAAIPA